MHVPLHGVRTDGSFSDPQAKERLVAMQKSHEGLFELIDVETDGTRSTDGTPYMQTFQLGR